MPNIIKLTDEEYFSDKTHVSKSMLDLLNKSPAHLATYLNSPVSINKDKKGALYYGNIIHKYILENEDFFNVYFLMPELDRRTTAGKLASLQIENANKSKICIKKELIEELDKLREITLSNKSARTYINNFRSEVACKWVNKKGIACKGKADLYSKSMGMVVDLKTYDNRKDFIDSIIKYRYDVQAAHYCEGFEVDKFMIIAVSKQLDCCEVFEFPEEYLAWGKSKRDKNLDEYKRIIDSGIWPGVDEPTLLELPEFYNDGDLDFDL